MNLNGLIVHNRKKHATVVLLPPSLHRVLLTLNVDQITLAIGDPMDILTFDIDHPCDRYIPCSPVLYGGALWCEKRAKGQHAPVLAVGHGVFKFKTTFC